MKQPISTKALRVFLWCWAVLWITLIIWAIWTAPAPAQVGYTDTPDPCQIQPNDVPLIQGGGGGVPVYDGIVASNTLNTMLQAQATQTNTDSTNQLALNACRAQQAAWYNNIVTGSRHTQVDNGIDAGPDSQAPTQ